MAPAQLQRPAHRISRHFALDQQHGALCQLSFQAVNLDRCDPGTGSLLHDDDVAPRGVACHCCKGGGRLGVSQAGEAPQSVGPEYLLRLPAVGVLPHRGGEKHLASGAQRAQGLVIPFSAPLKAQPGAAHRLSLGGKALQAEQSGHAV